MPLGLNVPDPWPVEPALLPWENPHHFEAYVVACVRYMASSKDVHTTMVVYKISQSHPVGRSFFEPEASYAD